MKEEADNHMENMHTKIADFNKRDNNRLVRTFRTVPSNDHQKEHPNEVV